MRALSGGMKRRVLVAQALVHKPPVIVLDEPTAGVDVELRQTLWKFIERLNQQGHTIVLTTHYLEEAQALCNRVAMLKTGKVLTIDSMSGLISRISGSRMRFTLTQGHLPGSLLPLQMPEAGNNANNGANQITLRLSNCSEVEPILAALRTGACQIEKLELLQSDLEDVFLQMMGDGK